MELKFTTSLFCSEEEVCFNRTFMELKYANSVQNLTISNKF